MDDFVDYSDVPKLDYLESYDLNDHHDLEEAIEIFCDDMKSGYFLRWEAVEQQERGLPLTEKQEEALSDIVSFGNDEDIDDDILYINGVARPSEPWHIIAKKIAEHLPVNQFKTSDIHCATTTEGWGRLAGVIEEHSGGLSLPEGISKPIDVVPATIRHKLRIQWCFSELEGIGQDKDITLRNKDDFNRIEAFIDLLRDCSDSVEYLELTLTKLMTTLILPADDHKILVDVIMNELKLPSPEHQMADFL